jgi:apolipoprotein N-acyltransferase
VQFRRSRQPFPSDATTVRVVGLSASQSAVATFKAQLPQEMETLLASGKATQADRALARSAITTVDDDLFARSQQEARAGAKIVVWPETSPTGASVLQEDEQSLIQRAGALARQEGIYLDMGLAVYLRDAAGPSVRDESVLLDPTGKVAWTYEIAHVTPGDRGRVVQGEGRVPTVAGPYGRLAKVICFDLDYPDEIRQAGRASTDILLAPSDDWRAIDPAHSRAAVFRAIENGFSLVRQTSKGLSLAVDSKGRVLAASDYFDTDQQVLVAYVPTHGVRTVYATIGDLFAWLCVLGLVALAGLALAQSRECWRSAPANLELATIAGQTGDPSLKPPRTDL